MKLIVKNSAGETVSIQIKSNETFMDLKERVEEEAGISLDLKDIALSGKRITETQRVMEYFLSSHEVEEEPLINVSCAVPGCENTKFTHPDKVFFEFPTEEIRCHQWVLYCQRLNSGQGKKRLSLGSDSTICSDHFTPDQFVKNTSTLLKRTAVPSVKAFTQNTVVPVITNEEPSPKYNFDNEHHKPFVIEESEDSKGAGDVGLVLCRLCASTSDEWIMIFGEFGRKIKLAEKINLCLPIKVEITDAYPKQICHNCFRELNLLYEMADSVSLAQYKLEEMAAEELGDDDDYDDPSMEDTCEEVILGSSSLIDKPFSREESSDEVVGGCCPLCIEGNMRPRIEEKNNTPPPNEADEQSIFGPALNVIDCNAFDLGSPVSKSYNFYCNYDTSDLDSQLGSSPPRVFKDSDPLKLDDSSRSDNESYSSFINCGDSSSKSMKENTLSTINEELPVDPDFYSMDTTESENSNMPSFSESPVFKRPNSQKSELVLPCRICGHDFIGYDNLEKHSLDHSFPGFYQCLACVVFFDSKDDLGKHYDKHRFPKEDVYYCEHCSKTFPYPYVLAAHGCKKDEHQGNKCSICSKQFRSEARLKHHMKYHDNSPSAYCNVCDKMFSDEFKLEKHSLYVHNARKSYCCEECGKVFKSEASMRYHQRSHQSEEDGVRPFICDRCGKSFARKSLLINHMSSSHKHSSSETSCFNCKLCFESFPTTAAAVSHMDNHHRLECMDEHTYSFEMLTITRVFICEYCERCFAESSVLNTHRERHPSESPYECKICTTSFPSMDEYKSHCRSHGEYEIPAEYLSDFSIPKTYLCEYCERCFLNHVKYNEHLTVHYGPEPYQCRHCTLRFSTLSTAMAHRSIHGDSTPLDDYNFYRPYECHYCSKTFAIEDALVKHIRMHTGEKPFICDQCGKGFSQSSGLYTHQKVHSSLRPYACTVCPRTFKIKGDRDVHVRKHSGDRPYKCEFCGKAFMTQHVYSQHRKIHTGERPYKCDVCGIAFRRSHVLTVHKRIHTGEKPNICDICGKRYRQKGDMLKHKRVQHGIVNQKPNVGPLLFT